MLRIFTAMGFIILFTAFTFADVINVPADTSTIQGGISMADNGDTVLVADGTYLENINFKGKAITVASHYVLNQDTLHISNTIIDGSNPANPDSGSVVTFNSGEDTTSVLMGFTVTGGTGTISEFIWDSQIFPSRVGGGILCDSSGASISQNRIMNNHIPDHRSSLGGGIAGAPNGSPAHVIINSNQIISNSTTGSFESFGGGIALSCNGTVLNNIISNNICTSNRGSGGAGISCWSETTRSVDIINNQITHNVATGKRWAVGGGIETEHAMSTTVIDNEISFNEVNSIGTITNRGGGILVVFSTETNIIDGNIITNNTMNAAAANGGGISLHENSGNTVISNNIVSENSAVDGGGINCLSSKTQIINNTIVNNNASDGGGIWMNNAVPVVLNTIIWGNDAASDPQISKGSGLISPAIAYSNIQGGWDGIGNMDADPLFSDTLFHLSDNSPCIGRGTNSIIINDVTINVPETDFDGNSRPNPEESNPDIGALENELGLPDNYILVPEHFATIQAAINAAENGDVVLVANGMYQENINFKGKAIIVSSNYFIDEDTSHISNTIIDGSNPANPDSGSVVTFESGEDSTSVLYGFTITGGSGTLSEYTWNNNTIESRTGGGIFCYNSGARITYNKIINNHIIHTEAGGGGVSGFPTFSTAHVIINNNQIMYNTLSGTYPGGAGITISCNATIKNNDILLNTTNGSNRAWGAVICWSEDSKNVEILGNKINHNTTSGIQRVVGGGIHIDNGVSASIINNDISYNETIGSITNRGAGIHVISSNRPNIIDRNKISNNMANGSTAEGGGISLLGNIGLVEINNNIISENSAVFGGGINSFGSEAQIINNTIVNNSADDGGGLWMNDTKPVVLNSIVWGNQATTDPQISKGFGTPTIVYSNIQGGWIGAGNIDSDPLFSDTLFHLKEGSPCIGRGIDSLEIEENWYFAPATDFEGDKRPKNFFGERLVDIGADESPYRVVVGIADDKLGRPFQFTLKQNYPNPFNPTTTISYNLPQTSDVDLSVFNLLGQKIASLVSKKQTAGSYKVQWDATGFASGVYLYILKTSGGFEKVRKLVLLK